MPYVRDDRETPLCVGRDGEGYAGDLGQKGMEIFLKEGLTGACPQLADSQGIHGVIHGRST